MHQNGGADPACPAKQSRFSNRISRPQAGE